MGQLQGASLRIVTVPQAPFVYYNPALPGNEAWSGYLIDFWDLVVQDINENNNQFFNFTFYNSPDGRFGGRDSSGVWNGMIKEILDGNADLAVADFTITAVRYACFGFLRS